MPRREKKFHYLYKTTNLLNNKFYVGMHSTDNLEDGYLGSGLRLRRSIRKYGKENFRLEILTFFNSRSDLIDAEKHLVNHELLKNEMCMNIRTGGEGGFISAENQFKRSQAGGLAMKKRMQDDSELFERISKQASEHLSKMRRDGTVVALNWTGRKHKKETIEAISQTKQGTGSGAENSQYGTCWIFINNENKKIKIEEIDKYILLGWKRGRV